MSVPQANETSRVGHHGTQSLRIVLSDLLSNVPILLHNNLVATLRCLDGVGLLVKILELLKCPTLGLDTGIISKPKFLTNM